jgi:hypothetical protein
VEATRRDALGVVAGAAAVAAMSTRAGAAAAAPELDSPVKTLFWTATITPCDESLAFDPLNADVTDAQKAAIRESLAKIKDMA